MSATTTNARFETTSWTLVRSARESRSALGELLNQYWSPVYAYARRAGLGRDDAAELTQEFIAEVMLRRDLVGRADPAAGRFRSYVKVALRNFMIDKRRSRTSGRAEPSQSLRDPFLLESAEPNGDLDPSDAYDRQWAKSVLTIALERVRRDCGLEGLSTHWLVFERRVLGPEMHGGDPPTLESIAANLGLGSADVVASMIFTVKRKLRSTVRQTIAETVSTTGDLDAEIAALRRALSR